jgi:glycosyltransferase involved in cell wall biosynthesis
MRTKKIRGIIFISNVTKAMEHEWFADFTDKEKFDFEFILFNSLNSELHNYLIKSGFRCRNYRLHSNYMIPFHIVFFTFLILKRRPDFVHCHLFQASLVGIISAKIAGLKKRIYTRHHTDVHHVYHPHAVKYDLLVNRLSTHIIAVSNNSRNVLVNLEQVDPSKITVIPHGIPEKLINKSVPAAEVSEMRKKYGLEKSNPIIGVISRFVPEKGIQYIIPAFKSLLSGFPEAKLVLANAKGKYENEILKFLEDLPAESYLLIKFENKIDPLFASFDVFVHAPIDETCEAFGQVYIEAMSLGVPMVCCVSGIAHDLVINERNALVAEYKSAESLRSQITRMLTDRQLRETIIRNAFEDVRKHTFEKKFAAILKIYES